MLVVVAIQLVDRWTLQIIGKIIRGGEGSRYGMLVDLAVIFLVATFAIAANIVLAVFLGVVVTVGVFLFRMSKSVIRREYQCNTVHSRKNREPRLMAVLSEHGGRIAVLELEGPIFFGTAENLAMRLDDLLIGDVSYTILDLKRVNEIDSTGARIIIATHDKMVKRGKHMLISGLDAHPPMAATLRDMGVITALGAGKLFADADGAIEWAEEHSSERARGSGNGRRVPIYSLRRAGRHEPRRLATMKALLERRATRGATPVFLEGRWGKELFMIDKGSASGAHPAFRENRNVRLVTFAPGPYWRTGSSRPGGAFATIEAMTIGLLHSPAREGVSLAMENPAIAIKLLANLGRELSARLRRANRTIYQLDS